VVCAGRGGWRGASRPCPDKGAVPEGGSERAPRSRLAPSRCPARGFAAVRVQGVVIFIGGFNASRAVPRSACLPSPPSPGTRSRLWGSLSLALFLLGWRVALGGCHHGRIPRGWGWPRGRIRTLRGGSGWDNGAVLFGFSLCSWGEVIPIPR